MLTEQKSPALDLPREAKTTPKEPIKTGGGFGYEEPQPIGISSELNIGKDLIDPQGLPPLFKNFEIGSKDGFYITESIKGSISDSTNGGSVVTRYISQRTDSYGVFFIAKRPCEVIWASELHVGTSSVTLDVLKVTTLVPAGVSVLKTTFDLSTTASTVVTRQDTTLSATLENRRLKPGDSLILSPSAAPTTTTEIFVELYMKYLGEGDYK